MIQDNLSTKLNLTEVLNLTEDKQFIVSSAIYCGSYEEAQLIGSSCEENEQWFQGIILREITKLSKVNLTIFSHLITFAQQLS